MIGPFAIAELKRLLLTEQHLSAIINAKHSPILVQKASALTHRPKHRLSLDLAPPYFPLLFRDFLRSVVLIPHMLHMLEQFLLNPRGRICHEVRRLGLHSTILISLDLFDPSLSFLDMNIW